jgi:hypothetical protein
MGPAARRSYRKSRLALPGSSWSFGIRQTNGALAWAGVAENFQPGFDVSGSEAPLLRPGVPGKPPRGAHLATKPAIASRQHRGTSSTCNPLRHQGLGNDDRMSEKCLSAHPLSASDEQK